MDIPAIKEKIVKVINDSKFQVNFIENKPGGLLIDVKRPTKYDHYKHITGLIRGEPDIGTFSEALLEKVN